MFDHPMKLHCSQTDPITGLLKEGFDHPMKLHCSQTVSGWSRNRCRLTIL